MLKMDLGKQSVIDRLQNVQNSAARIITRTKKYDHIKPVLKQLHWRQLTSALIIRYYF